MLESNSFPYKLITEDIIIGYIPFQLIQCYSPSSSTVPLFISESVLGTQGRLPCNVTPPIEADKVILVIWYKDGLSTPIYRYVHPPTVANLI